VWIAESSHNSSGGPDGIPLVWHTTDIHGKKGDHTKVNMTIVSVNQMENGIVVNFQDGACAFFDAAFLYAQTDKRLIADFGDPSSTPSRLGW
jgi:hypothetical protein